MIGSLLGQGLRTALCRPQTLVIAVLIVVVPSVWGFIGLPGTAFPHWTHYFTTMFDWLAVVFPLVVTLLTQPQLLDEWANTYAWQTRPRVAPRTYFLSKCLISGVLAFVVFFAMTVVAALVAVLTYTDKGIAQSLPLPLEESYSFSQLWGVSPFLYVAVYCLWVGVVSGAVAVVCTMFTAVIRNSFTALVAPFLVWTVANFGLAVVGLEALALPPFRFHITQQPAWTEFAGLGAIVAVAVGFYVFIASRRFQTAG